MFFPFMLHPPHSDVILYEREVLLTIQSRDVLSLPSILYSSSIYSKLSTVEYKELHVKAISRLGRKINMQVLI